jgi:hypothetical protein
MLPVLRPLTQASPITLRLFSQAGTSPGSSKGPIHGNPDRRPANNTTHRQPTVSPPSPVSEPLTVYPWTQHRFEQWGHHIHSNYVEAFWLPSVR